MSFERAHAYARREPVADDELDDLAPGRWSAAARYLTPSRPLLSGLIQRKPSGDAIADDPTYALAAASASAGLPLPALLRRKFEAALGVDLSAVRIHTGGASHAAAIALGAKAYTLGQDIHFASQHDPTAAASEALLAHEVAHTVQQRGGTPVAQHKLEVSTPGDSFEHEADRAADAMVAGTAFAVGAAPVVAARKAADDADPGDLKPMTAPGFPIATPTPVYSAPDLKSSVLANLPRGGAIQITGSIGSFYRVSYDGTKQGYIDSNDMDVDGTPTAVDSAPAPDAGSAPAAGQPADPNSAGARYRSAIVKALDFWKGAVEGGADGKFAKFRSPETLDKARKASGKEHKTFTTCIEFLSQVQLDAQRDSNTKQSVPIDANLATAKGRKKLPKDAWHAASANMTQRPAAGDVLFFTFAANVKNTDGTLKFGKGWFSHVGYFNGLTKLDAKASAAVGGDDKDAVELWHTVDGGQGTATKYDDKGNVTQAGHEELKQSDRYYHPAKNLISGEKIQGDGDARTLLGWVDVSKIVASEAPPDPD